MRIALIPTGQMELMALGPALERLFPGHEFYAVPERAHESKPFDGFTSLRLPARSKPGTPSNLDTLVAQLASEVCPGRGGQPADLAIIIDDLEHANRDQPDVVLEEVRKAVHRHLEKQCQHRPHATVERIRTALRERASFHLAVPMIESWFFATSDILSQAGVPVERLPAQLRQGHDPEMFETDDPVYKADDGSGCNALVARRRGKRSKKASIAWNVSSRERHPKAYLSWLCRNPDDAKKCTAYRETGGGANALRELDWTALLANDDHYSYVRALVCDIAELLDPDQCQAWAGTGTTTALTCRSHAPANAVLRNL